MALAATAVLAFLYSIASRTPLGGILGDWSLTFILGATLAHVFALFLSVKLIHEFPTRSKMRLAWQLIAASIVAALLRHLIECLFIGFGWRADPMFGIRQIPLLIALVLLLAGLVVMWSAFSSLGLGLHAQKVDLAGLAGILILAPAALIFERQVVDNELPLWFVRMLTLANPFLLAAPAGVSILLYRISVQLGEGQLARSLRYLAVFPTVRLLLIVLNALPGHFSHLPAVDPFRLALQSSVSWFLALAIAERWQLTLQAKNKMKEYETAAPYATAGSPFRHSSFH
jgi:hypothetical protein